METERPGQKIRRFFADLLGSRHARFLESELVRTRLHYDAIIRELREERLSLEKKLEKFETLLLPQMERLSPEYQAKREAMRQAMQSTAEIAAGRMERSWTEALAQHNRELERLEKLEKQKEAPNGLDANARS